VSNRTVISFGGVSHTPSDSRVIPESIAVERQVISESLLEVVSEEQGSQLYQEMAAAHEEDIQHYHPPTVEEEAIDTQIILSEQQQFFHEKPRAIGESFWSSVESVSHKSGSKLDWVWVIVLLGSFGIAFGGIAWVNRTSPTQVLSANTSKTEVIDSKAYAQWSEKYFGKVAGQAEDNDTDQLSNIEEYKLGSDPTKYSSCDNNKSDAETLYELVDPKSCKKIQVSDDEVLGRVSQVMDLKRFNQQLASKSTSSSTNSQSSLIDELIQNQILSKDQILATEQKLAQQKQYAELLEKIAAYMQKYRSYSVLDRDYDLPVTSDVFLKISLKYNAPLKYMIAIARLESRFGSDRYTDSGAETRPSQYKNMFSIGLDDSGNNLSYATWEDGVEGFGRWYKNLQDKGVSDCAKWKLYNPNGDYCSKVEEGARIFEDYKPGLNN
jgi:hypothetical protein